MGPQGLERCPLLPRGRREPNHQKTVRVSPTLGEEIPEAFGDVTRAVKRNRELQPYAVVDVCPGGRWDLPDGITLLHKEHQPGILQRAWWEISGGPVRPEGEKGADLDTTLAIGINGIGAAVTVAQHDVKLRA